MPTSPHPRFRILLLLSATIAGAQTVPSTQTPASANPDVTRNFPYTADAAGTYQADFYQPSTTGPHLAVVAFHGGSWRSGHKTEMRRLCTDLAAHGFACFSIDYDTHAP